MRYLFCKINIYHFYIFSFNNSFILFCRYAFIRYNSVDESISAYKQAHDLMWDTRSIIVRFRRQRGNTCLPGEPKPNIKKTKEEPNSNSQIKKCQKVNHIEKSVTKLETDTENKVQDNCNKMQNKTSQIQEQNTNLQSSSSSSIPTSITSAKSGQQQQPWVQVYCRNIIY